MTQAVTTFPTSVPNFGTIAEMGWGNVLWLVAVGFVIWAFKKDWIGIITFGPYDRGFREFFGRPGRLLGQGPHPHLVGLGNLRRASVAITIITLSGRVNVANKVYAYIIVVSVSVVDEIDHVRSAIYKTFDEGKKDSYNAQRTAYTKTMLEEEARHLLETTGDTSSVTVESLTERCGDHLLLMCGTAIKKAMLTEFTLVDAQILKDGLVHPRDPGEAESVADADGTVVSFQQHQQGSA